MKQMLLIMAKVPRPGTCKTRLCPPLSPEQAAELYRGFLLDTLAGARAAMARETVPTTVVLIHPQGDAEAMRSLLPFAVNLHEQPKGDLGATLNGLFSEYLADGCERVIIIGTDSPSMPTEFLLEALAAPNEQDVVLGRARDGGYYLIGLKRPVPRLFEEIAWSTSQVYAQTVERAAELGLRVYNLPPWYDIDTVSELHELVREIELGARVPETATFFRQHPELLSSLRASEPCKLRFDS